MNVTDPAGPGSASSTRSGTTTTAATRTAWARPEAAAVTPALPELLA
jgi:hypothetical protein